MDLLAVLPMLAPFTFVEEAAYRPDTVTFRRTFGFDILADTLGEPLTIGEARPDLIQTLPSRRNLLASRAANQATHTPDEPETYRLAVQPDGDLLPISDDDSRLRLRVIDIKLASEPGAHYFAEVVYYALTLAAWLHEEGLDDRFVVVAASAVWPGSYDDSALTLAARNRNAKGLPLDPQALTDALAEDLEIAPFDTFAARLRRFFCDELPGLLATPWHDLQWHVHYGCAGCDFLGLSVEGICR